MKDESVEDLIRDLVRHRRAAGGTAGTVVPDWRPTLQVIEAAAAVTSETLLQADERESRHLDTADEALGGIWDALARLEAADAAQRLWTECAEVAEARLEHASQGIDALEEALRLHCREIDRSPRRERVISLLLEGLDRALQHLARNALEREHVAPRAGRRGIQVEPTADSGIRLRVKRTHELRPSSLAA